MVLRTAAGIKVSKSSFTLSTMIMPATVQPRIFSQSRLANSPIFVFVGKTHQWPNGKTELHAQDNLASDQQLGGFAFAKNADYEDRRNNRQGSGDQPAQPRSNPKVQKTFHYNLASERAGERRVLSRSEERHREKNARDSHAEQRTE